MKIFGISIVSLLLATAAFADDRNLSSFQKNELGVLGSIQLEKFHELYRYTTHVGKIHVYINVKRPGEIIEKDISKGTDQERYFADTKSAILSDLGGLVLWQSELGPTMPDLYMYVRPGALLMILHDSRISNFSIIKDRLPRSIDGISAEINALPDCDSSIQAVEKTPFYYPRTPFYTETDGYVFLAFTVQMDGSVSDISILQAEPPRIFNRSAIRGLMGWRFSKPAAPCRGVERIKYALEN